jgi:hypothetical protein
MTALPEVFVIIKFFNGDRLTRRFATCEAAWLWERKTRHLHARRRRKADRLEVMISLYAGCTIHGNSYGGILYGSDTYGVELPSYLRYEENRRSK